MTTNEPYDVTGDGLPSSKEPLGQERITKRAEKNDREFLSPLTGRARQLTEIEKAFLLLENGEGGLFIISGEAGVGKSRLLEELHQRLPKVITWLEGRSLSFSQRISYWPFIELFRVWLGFSETASNEVRWETFEQSCLTLLGAESGEILPYIATLMGMDVPEPHAERVRYIDGEELGAQIRRSVRRFIERLAQERPLVLVIDDLHWADQSSIFLLEHLLPLALTMRVLFVVLGRPENEVLGHLREVASQVLPDRSHNMLLLPLSVRDSQSLITHLVGDDFQTRRVRDVILYKTGGNPYFIEEVIRGLIESRKLVRDEFSGSWTVLDPDASIAIPDTVQGVIMTRLERLDERLRDVLGIASVIGRQFLYRVLHAVTESEMKLDERLANLTAAQIIDEIKSAPELAYLFHHALAQEKVYESVAPDTRSLLHDRVGAAIEELYAGRLHEVASLLAFHYSRGVNNWDRALHFMLEAADQSSRMAADSEALAHYEEAVQRYGHQKGDQWDKEQRTKMELRLGEIYFRRGEYALTIDHLKRALELSGESSLPRAGLELRFAQFREFMLHIANFLTARDLRGFSGTASSADKLTIAVYEALAWAMYLSSPEYVVWLAFRLINRAQRAGFAEGVADGYSVLGDKLDQLGRRRLAYRYHQRAKWIAERFARESMGAVNLFRGLYYFRNGHWVKAQQAFMELVQISDRSGDLRKWAVANAHLCDLWSETGELQSALALSEKIIKRGYDSAFQLALRWGLLERGKSLRRMGRHNEAEVALKEALPLAIGFRDKFTLVLLRAELVLCLVERGRTDEAQSILDDLVELTNSASMPIFARFSASIAVCEHSLFMLEQRVEDKRWLKEAERCCATLSRMAHGHRCWSPVTSRLIGRFEWLRGRKRQAQRQWRRGIAAAAEMGARLEVGLTHLEMSRRLEQTEVAEQWRMRLDALNRK